MQPGSQPQSHGVTGGLGLLGVGLPCVLLAGEVWASVASCHAAGMGSKSGTILLLERPTPGRGSACVGAVNVWTL